MKHLTFVALALTALPACNKDEPPREPTEQPAAQDPAAATAPAETQAPAERATPAGPEPGDSIVGQEITYRAGDTTLQGYLAYDESVEGQRPGVLVVHEWWGNTEYPRHRARQLAELGYTALALDMYGDGKTADHPKDAQSFASAVSENQEVAMARFTAARDVLQQHETTDPDRVAAIGYCFGGSIVLEAARAGVDLDAVAAFHAGSLSPSGEAERDGMDTKVMVFHGEADPMVPPEQVEGFRKEMQQRGADLTFESYPGAKHAFTNPEATEKGRAFDMPLEYSPEADTKSWEAMKAGLAEAFSG